MPDTPDARESHEQTGPDDGAGDGPDDGADDGAGDGAGARYTPDTHSAPPATGAAKEGPTAAPYGTSLAPSARTTVAVPRWRQAIGVLSRPRTTSASARGARVGTREIVDGLDDRERLISMVAAILAIAYVVYIIVDFATHRIKPTKGAVNPDLAVAVIAVPALALLVAAIIRRRALAGFGAVFIGLEFWALSPIIGLPFLGLGGWLVFRVMSRSRQRREDALRSRSSPAGSSRGSSRRPSTRSGSRSAAPGKSTELPAERRPPARSKRYTPPKSASNGRKRTTAR